VGACAAYTAALCRFPLTNKSEKSKSQEVHSGIRSLRRAGFLSLCVTLDAPRI